MNNNQIYFFLSVVVFISIGYFIYFSRSSVVKYQKLNQQIDMLETELETARKENMVLRAQIKRISDPEFSKALLIRNGYLDKDEMLVEMILPEIHTNRVENKPFYSSPHFIYYAAGILITGLLILVMLLFRHRRSGLTVLMKKID